MTEQTNSATAGKYLTFHLANEEYGVEILKVQEIIGMMTVTRVPRTPRCIRGVVNLRGKVIPVIDLRLKFELDGQPDTERTCIIVVQLRDAGQMRVTGIIVDEVSEVVAIAAEMIEPAPSFGGAVNTDYILGMAKLAQKVITMLDIGKVLAPEETEALAGLAGAV